ncbi:MAG: hypothetical protein A2905_03040 [Candidatus Levybacteria bacterium RIFCSPLOWO2_01_FULL_36_10]|nr:MAG: hypothetical protein A2905_03040 [Candidatus Levybacteria bacterium RIFCSPLOWO2_01_FULL_36_10]
MKRPILLLTILFIIAMVFEVVNVYLLNKVTTDSIYVIKIKQEISSYKQKNIVLKTEILESTSMNMIASRASDLGFVESKEVISLYSPLTVAVGK